MLSSHRGLAEGMSEPACGNSYHTNKDHCGEDSVLAWVTARTGSQGRPVLDMRTAGRNARGEGTQNRVGRWVFCQAFCIFSKFTRRSSSNKMS